MVLERTAVGRLAIGKEASLRQGSEKARAGRTNDHHRFGEMLRRPSFDRFAPAVYPGCIVPSISDGPSTSTTECIVDIHVQHNAMLHSTVTRHGTIALHASLMTFTRAPVYRE